MWPQINPQPAEPHPGREGKNTRYAGVDELTFADALLSDMKRDNANIADVDSPMGVMLKYGSEGAKDYSRSASHPGAVQAHRCHIHIHDFDFYT
jgi:ribonucleoside-triphosphate reductase